MVMSDSRYGASEASLLRYETYARGMRRLTYAAIFSSVAGLAGILVGGWAMMNKPEPRYFATQVNGQILPLVPLDQPHLTDNQVINFAVEAVTRALTMDFANWRRDLNDAKIYFQNPEGFNNFLSALERSGNLNLIRNSRMTSSAVANGATIVESGRNARSAYTWRIEIPLTVTYESSSRRTTQNLLGFVEVVRLPTFENPYGVGVSRFVAQSR